MKSPTADQIRQTRKDAGLADQIRQTRKDAGLTRAQLAAFVGSSVSAIDAWECGHRNMPPEKWVIAQEKICAFAALLT